MPGGRSAAEEQADVERVQRGRTRSIRFAQHHGIQGLHVVQHHGQARLIRVGGIEAVQVVGGAGPSRGGSAGDQRKTGTRESREIQGFGVDTGCFQEEELGRIVSGEEWDSIGIRDLFLAGAHGAARDPERPDAGAADGV